MCTLSPYNFCTGHYRDIHQEVTPPVLMRKNLQTSKPPNLQASRHPSLQSYLSTYPTFTDYRVLTKYLPCHYSILPIPISYVYPTYILPTVTYLNRMLGGLEVWRLGGLEVWRFMILMTSSYTLVPHTIECVYSLTI